MSKINGNLQPKPGVSNVNMGTAQNKFNNLYINSIICGGTAVSGVVVDSTDANTSFHFGRGGMFGDADTFNIGHRDCLSPALVGFRQSKYGHTLVNCRTSSSVRIQEGGSGAIATFSALTINFFSPLECRTITTNTAEISEVGWNNTDLSGTMAVFSHKNRATTNNYAFQQHSGGTTYINSGDTWPDDGTGQINLRINNDNVATFQASLITFIVPTSGPSDRRFKKNITVPLPSKNWTDFKLIEIKQYNKVYPNINSDKLRLGVIAQELEAIDNPICKNAVKEITLEKPTDPVELDIYKQGQIFTDTSGEEHSGGFKAVEYEQLYRMNIAVTQQLMARVEALEAKIISLLDNA